jgi:hypothetical protein
MGLIFNRTPREPRHESTTEGRRSGLFRLARRGGYPAGDQQRFRRLSRGRGSWEAGGRGDGDNNR